EILYYRLAYTHTENEWMIAVSLAILGFPLVVMVMLCCVRLKIRYQEHIAKMNNPRIIEYVFVYILCAELTLVPLDDNISTRTSVRGVSPSRFSRSPQLSPLLPKR
ncbi:hypothetical protein LSH36_330g07051, partial [Paralvinella palmiformis]